MEQNIAKELRDTAAALKEKIAEVESANLVKCAKYIVGLTSLVKLRNILRSK